MAVFGSSFSGLGMEGTSKLGFLWMEARRSNSTFGTGAKLMEASAPDHFIAQFFFSAVVFAVANLVFQRLHFQTSRLPPGPSAWEFIFQTYVLRRKPEVVLQNFAKRFGAVMHMRLWSQDMLVISSVAAAEEFYKLHDMEFGARPSSMGKATISNWVQDLWFTPRAAYWKHLRFVLDMTTSTPSGSGSMKEIEWALDELHHYPKVMQHIREEIETDVEARDKIQESDIFKLPYLQAVVKELFRLHPPSQFAFPHESSDDYCQLFGFEVPPHTQVFINIYAVQRDPVMWVSPHEFNPARFVCCPEFNTSGQYFQLIPFGAGRRKCPGYKLATDFVLLSLARYVQNTISFHKE